MEPPDLSIEPQPSVTHDELKPQSGTKPKAKTSQQTQITVQVFDERKMSLRRRCESVVEGTYGADWRTPLNLIFTELYITGGQSLEADEHEARQL